MMRRSVLRAIGSSMVAAAVMLTLAVPAAGRTVLVKDINPGSRGSNPHSLTDVNGALYFNTFWRPPKHDAWRSSGKAAGTARFSNWRAREFTAYGKIVLFQGGAGRDLSKTEGTDASTKLVKAIGATELTPFVGLVYFGASGGLWRTDGTSAGTELVLDICAQDMLVIAGVLFFSCELELWKRDGTRSGTKLVKDIRRADTDSNDSPQHLTAVGGSLYFTADANKKGRELWRHVPK